MRVSRNFEARPESERAALCKETWCGICQQADLGLLNPVEYQSEGRVFVEGACRKCGATVVGEIVETQSVS
jgi:hypothetical protein